MPLPIIDIEAQAPDSAAAVRLADAAVSGLRGYLASKAANENVAAAGRLHVTGLGSPQVRQDIRGPKRVVALGVAVFVFLCGCLSVLFLSTLAPGWRLSALAPGWLRKLVPGRMRADAASKDIDDTDASGAANTGESSGGGSGAHANGGGKDGSAVAGAQSG
jgi:hypothetical protein